MKLSYASITRLYCSIDSFVKIMQGNNSSNFDTQKNNVQLSFMSSALSSEVLPPSSAPSVSVPSTPTLTQTTQPKYFLHITIDALEIRHNESFEDIYFSFAFNDVFHFTSAVSSKTTHINDDIFLEITHLCQFLKFQRWQNHMIMFDYEIDISQLLFQGKGLGSRSRSTKKKVETKQGQIVSMTIKVYGQKDLMFQPSCSNKLIQQYLKIDKVSLIEEGGMQKKNQKNIEERCQKQELQPDGFSYFEIHSSQQKYILPILNSQLIVQIPDKFQFLNYRKGKLVGRSDWLSFEQHRTNQVLILLVGQQQNSAQLKIHLKWITNLFCNKLESTILHETHELCIYDIQVKFENYKQLSNSKLKFVYGNKAFQLNGELNQRILHFQRIIYFITKSENEEIVIYCEKNGKIIAEARFSSAEFLSFKVSTLKKSFHDIVSHRQMGIIKFFCQKTKNASLPSNNSFWRQNNKNKSLSKILLKIQQISVFYEKNIALMGILKTQRQNFKVYPLANFSHYQNQSRVHDSIQIPILQKTSIYMVIKQKQKEFSNQNDYIGIALIDYQSLRLGLNSVSIPFYKNQMKIMEANCLINKVVPHNFVKAVFQPEIPMSIHTKTLSLSVHLGRIDFQPYFLSYAYWSKPQVYCVVEIGKAKKVVILQNTQYDTLHFQISKTSDNLNFIVKQSEFIKVKLIFLVSESGKEEESYGALTIRVKLSSLMKSDKETFINNLIRNQFGIIVGSVSLELRRGLHGGMKSERDKEMRRVNQDIAKVNRSIEKVQKSRNNKRRYVSSQKQVQKKVPYHNRQSSNQKDILTESIIIGSQKQL